MEDSRKNNTGSNAVIDQYKEENRSSSASKRILQRRLTLPQEQEITIPAITTKEQYGLIGQHYRKDTKTPGALDEQHLTHKSQVASGEFIISIKDQVTTESVLVVAFNGQRINPVIYINCVNPSNAILRNDQVNSKDTSGRSKLLPHNSDTAVNGLERSGTSCSRDPIVQCKYSSKGSGSGSISEDSFDQEPAVVKVKQTDVDLYKRQFYTQCSDADDNLLAENLNLEKETNSDFENKLNVNLAVLEENIEAKFEELYSKMSEFDIEEKNSSLLTPPDTPRRVSRAPIRSISDSDGTDCQIEMEKYLEGKVFELF